MKKVIYLLILMFEVSATFTSCKKDVIEPVEPEITAANFIGNWATISYEYDGNVFETCNDFTPNYTNLEACLLDINIVSETDITVTDRCGGWDSHSSQLYYKNNQLIIQGPLVATLTFDILEFEGNSLKLKLVEENFGNSGLIPIGGIYNMTK